MRGFLLTYNPLKSGIDYFEELISDTEIYGEAENNWSCGNRVDLPPGSVLFLMRLGVEPKGLLGLGTAVSWPHEELHWNPEKARAGVTSMFVDFRFTALSRDPLFPLDELEHRFPHMRWTPQISGIEIPAAILQRLLDEWPSRGTVDLLYPEEVQPGTTYEEGGVRRVLVDAYERNRHARDACVRHYGCACSVCDVTLESIYGAIASGFIHVHHVRPLSEVGREYRVDPIRDLRPVCPNCHAILHRNSSVLSVEELRSMLRNPRVEGAV